MFLDNLDLIVTHDGDGGDTAQNEGFFAITCLGKVSNYNDVICKLDPKMDGNWVRHPTQYPDTKDFSRDQAVSNIIAMGLLGYMGALSRMTKAQIKHFGLYQNGDLILPDNIGQFIRAFAWKSIYPSIWLAYPFLWFSDWFMVINTLIICFIKARKPGFVQRWLGKHVHWIFVQGEPNNRFGQPQDEYGDSNVGTDKNHIASLYQAQKVMPTLVSLLARKIYKHFRPHGAQYALNLYYQVDNIEIAQAWTKNLENF